MTDEEKKAIERIDYIQDFIIENGQYNADVEELKNFSILLNLILKQEKVIDKMAKFIESNGYYTYGYTNKRCDIIQADCFDKKDCQNCMKQYFYRKVENND